MVLVPLIVKGVENFVQGKKQVREAFNRLAGEWDERALSSRTKSRYLLSFLTIPSSSTVLDVGSGTGILIPFLREKMGSSGLIVELDVALKKC